VNIDHAGAVFFSGMGFFYKEQDLRDGRVLKLHGKLVVWSKEPSEWVRRLIQN
jgi:hypothetical protein